MLESRGRAAVEHETALFAGRRTDIDDPVGAADHIEVVLDHKQRITGALQLLQGREQGLGIRGV